MLTLATWYFQGLVKVDPLLNPKPIQVPIEKSIKELKKDLSEKNRESECNPIAIEKFGGVQLMMLESSALTKGPW